ncbi:protein kinase [Gordonia desulfuricans]|uniref:non-specific serine/threonine protein kinase n=1 Tax=Gordonia desulfuricans TaxID=89051 RepID=A0A7K3LU79_9ACTN|nr:protein kinase [Gordonia desulfuricans]NDK91830.1 protein kinase [Gordonia desulfuricans]
MPLSPGSQIAGYRVVSLLGSGGMGEVYLVENPQLLRREALKVISLAGAQDPDFQRRFTNEARTTASLDHPSIISIHQYGITDGTPWFTMNYLEGSDLTHGPISAADVVTVTERVADALDYAHRRQVIHRDVKPANIFVSRDASGGGIERVTVLDFGIAKLVNSTSLTATSAFIGTLAYCAPEVIEGHDATAMSDQYSLACTVFQLFTGQAPFTTTTPSALVMSHLTKPIPPISSLRPDLGAFDAVLTRALAKNPADRYPDCRSFAAALKSAVDGSGEATVIGPAGGHRPATPAPVGTPIPSGGLSNPPSYPNPGHPNPPSHPNPGSYPNPAQPNPGAYPASPGYPGTPPPTPYPSQPGIASGPTMANPTAGLGGPGTVPLGGGQPPTYPPSQPNHLVGGVPGQPYGQPQPPQRKKRTGLIVGVIAVAAVVIVAAAVGIAFAAGAFSGSKDDDVTAAQPFTMSAYGKTTCTVQAGKAYCWGKNGSGELGIGSTTDSTTPVEVGGLSGVTAISVGGYADSDRNSRTTVCAVAGGEAYCWGNDHYGQIGDGATGSGTDKTSPTKVPNLTGVTSIATGYGSTCAVANGDVLCWGDNDSGQLGLPGVDETTTPTKVAGLPPATAVATAQGTTCAIAEGKAYCWGDNDNAQIGNGSTSRQESPVQVANLTDVTSLSVGTYTKNNSEDTPTAYVTVCATSGGGAYCWGDNAYGQIGDGSTQQRSVPTQATGLSGASVISTGWGSTCAVADAKVWCWGDNDNSQLGTTGDGRQTPAEVTGLTGQAVAVETAGGSTCSRNSAGEVYCWGHNDVGQLGDGSTSDRSTPVKLTLPA